MALLRETVRDLLEEPIARAKADVRSRPGKDGYFTDLGHAGWPCGAIRDERAQLGRARPATVAWRSPGSCQRGPLMVQPYLKPVPDWEEHEKPTMPARRRCPGTRRTGVRPMRWYRCW